MIPATGTLIGFAVQTGAGISQCLKEQYEVVMWLS